MCMYCVGDRRTYGLDMNNKFKVALHKLYAKYEYKYERGTGRGCPEGVLGRVNVFLFSAVATQTQENGVQTNAYPSATAASSCAR